MSSPLLCPKCGAILVGEVCDNCKHVLSILDQGFTVNKTQAGWVLTDPQGSSQIITSLGERVASRISQQYSISITLVKNGFATAAQKKPEVKEEPEEEQFHIIQTPTVKGPDYLAEMVWDGKTQPKYLVKRFGSDVLEDKLELSLGECDDRGRNIIYRPPYNDHLTKGLVLVPKQPTPCTFGDVIKEAFEFVLNPLHYDPCGNVELLKLLTLITMGSWFLDKMIPKTSIPIAGVGRFAPIIPIRGPSGSGKNRLANLLRFIAYRPYFDLSKSMVPSLFRPLDMWRGTLVMDEGDFHKTGVTSDLIHFLNSRATGTPISRQNPDDPKVGQAFESFGITILTQRQQFDDNATEDRSIPYYSQKSMTKLPTLEIDELVEQGLSIQNKLLYLRFAHWDQYQIDKRFWHKQLTDARLNAGLLPVIALSKFDPEINTVIDQCVASIEDTKRRLKANSMDGQIVNLLWEKIEDGFYEQYNQLRYIIDSREIIKDEKGNEQTITKALTMSIIKERLNFSTKTSRKIINSLGIEPPEAPPRIRVGKTNPRPIFFDPLRMEKQLREFIVGYETWQLYDLLGITIPSVPGVPDSVPDTPKEKETVKPSLDTVYTPTDLVQAVQVDRRELIPHLLAELKDQGPVGELWPRYWLEQHGIPRGEAENVIVGLRDAGKMIRTETGWATL